MKKIVRIAAGWGVASLAFLFAFPAVADTSSATWGNSMSYTTGAAAQAVYNQAQDDYLRRNGMVPGTVVYTDNSTRYTTNTTNCMVTGGCQTGGTATNVNGYTSTATTIAGVGNTVSSGSAVSTTGTKQDSTATSVNVPASSIDAITIGGK